MSKLHAKRSPSTLDNLSHCVRFEHIPMEDAGTEGTDMHEAYTSGSLAGLLDDERKSAVQNCIDYTNSLLATEGGPDCWHDICEARLELRDLTWGHSDRILLHKTKPLAHVLDVKFTRVEGQHDFQLRTYGACLVEMFTEALANDDKLLRLQSSETGAVNVISLIQGRLEKVTTHLVAPRLRKIDVVEHNPMDLLVSVRQQIDMLYARCNDQLEPPTPNDVTCQRCANAPRCPALNKVAVTLSRGLGLPMPSEFELGARATPEDRARAEVLRRVFVNWAETVAEHNKEFVAAGGTIPGFKVITRSTGDRIDKEDTATAAILLRDMGVTVEDILNASRLSINDLVDIVAGGDPDRTKKGTKEEIVTALASVIKSGSTSYLSQERRIPPVQQLQEINDPK